MFNLAVPRAFQLENPPLVVAVGQVHFPLVADFQDLAGIASFQKAVRHLFPVMDQVQQQHMSLILGPMGPMPSSTAERAVAWKFTNDEGWILSLEAGAVTLAVGSDYSTVTTFEENWSAVLEALRQSIDGVVYCNRVGIRYVNLVEISESSWTTWFKPEIVGVLAANVLDSISKVHVNVCQTHIVTTAEPSKSQPIPPQALIRYGLLPPDTNIAFEPLSPPISLQTPSFLIDMDLFLDGRQAFLPDAIVAQFLGLHSQVEAFFWWSLSEAGKQHFGVLER